MKYINADKLIAEIEKRKGYISVTHFAEELLSFINSLQQEQHSHNLEKAAEEYANKEYPDEPCIGQWGTGDYEPPIDREYDREIAKNAFKEGVKVITDQRVSLGYLISWYIQSVDRHQPIWTEEHLKELDKDFILIPKSLNNH